MPDSVEEPAEDGFDHYAGDDAPTDRLPVADLLRREGKWDKRRAGKIGALAAGVAAVAGIAATVLSTGQLHDTAAPVAGGTGGGPVSPGQSATGESATGQPGTSADLPVSKVSTTTSESAPQGGSTSSQSGTAQAPQEHVQIPVPHEVTFSAAGAGSTSSSGGSTPSPAARTSAAPSTTTTTTAPPADDSSNPPPAQAPAARTTTSTSPQQSGSDSGGGVLSVVGSLLGGILGK